MPNYTPNYNLVKPLDTEFYNVNDQNSNMDAIDLALNTNKQQMESLSNSFNEFNENEYIPTIQDLRAKTQVATTSEAQAGMDNTKVMTPLRVKESIQFNKRTNLVDDTDLNNLKVEGEYLIYRAVNAPSEFPALVTVNVYNNDYVFQTFEEVVSGRSFSRKSTDSTTWGTWQEITPTVLFPSVSNGKAQVASAITDKGVITASNATFATLANNVSQISTGPQTATGTATATNTISANLQNGTTETGLGLVVVTGLGFTPRKIKIYRNDGIYFYETNYDATNSSPFNGALMSTFTNGPNNNRNLNLNPNSFPCYVRQGEFALPVQMQGQTYNWYAEA